MIKQNGLFIANGESRHRSLSYSEERILGLNDETAFNAIGLEMN